MDWRLRRIGQAVVTVFVVLTLSFAMIRLMPGSAIDYLIIELESAGVAPDRIAATAEQLTGVNPDKPIHIAYVDYMTSVLQGDLGKSTYYGKPVAAILASAAPWTVFLLSWAICVGFSVGISLGALMAYWEGSKFDIGLTVYGVIMSSIPYYIFALLLVLVFGYKLGWFPVTGYHDGSLQQGFNWPYVESVIRHAVLPVFSLVFSGSIASLTMRGNSIRVLGEDYLRVARLRGISDTTIALQYVARNAILPMYTGLMISIGGMFGGAVILEEIFGYRGLGYYLLRAVQTRDYPLMMGAFTLITVAVVISLLFADLTYGKLDPRIGGEGSREEF